MGTLLDEFKKELSLKQSQPGFDKKAFGEEFLASRGHSKPAGLPPKRPGVIGAVKDIGASAVRGLVIGFPETMLQVARTIDQEGGRDILRDAAGRGIKRLKEIEEGSQFLRRSKESEKGVRSLFTQAAEAAPVSVAATVPGAIIGGAIGQIAIPIPFVGAAIGAAVGAGLNAGTIFGVANFSQTQDEIDDAIINDKSLTDEQRDKLAKYKNVTAIKSASAEAGFEFLSGALTIATAGLFNRIPGAKQGLKNTIAGLLTKQKSAVAKALGATAIAEGGTEAATAAVQVKLRKDLGLNNDNVLDRSFEAFGVGALVGLFFGGGLQIAGARQRSKIKQAISDANTGTKTREKAVSDIAEGIRGNGKNDAANAMAKSFETNAKSFIERGKPVSLDTDLGTIKQVEDIAEALIKEDISVEQALELRPMLEGRPELLDRFDDVVALVSRVQDQGGVRPEGMAEDVTQEGSDAADIMLDPKRDVILEEAIAEGPTEAITAPEVKPTEELAPAEKPAISPAPKKLQEELKEDIRKEVQEKEEPSELEAIPEAGEQPKAPEAVKTEEEEEKPAVPVEVGKAKKEKAEEPGLPKLPLVREEDIKVTATPEERKAVKAPTEATTDKQFIRRRDNKFEEVKGEQVLEEFGDFFVFENVEGGLEGESRWDIIDARTGTVVEASASDKEHAIELGTKFLGNKAKRKGLEDKVKQDVISGFLSPRYQKPDESLVTEEAQARIEKRAPVQEDLDIIEARFSKKTDEELKAIIQNEDAYMKRARPELERLRGINKDKKTTTTQKAFDKQRRLVSIAVNNKATAGVLLDRRSAALKESEALKPGEEVVIEDIEAEDEDLEEHVTPFTGIPFSEADDDLLITELAELGGVGQSDEADDIARELAERGVEIPENLKEEVAEVPKAKPGESKAEKEFEETSIEDITALIAGTEPKAVEEVKAAEAKRKGKVPASTTEKKAEAKKVEPKTASDILKEATSSGFKASGNALKGLHELFGGASLKSLPGAINEDTWKKAKPLFQEAWQDAINSGKSLTEFVKFVVDNYGNSIKPYLTRWAEEGKGVEVGPVDVGEPVEKPKEPVKKEKKAKKKKEEPEAKAEPRKRLKDVGEEMYGKRSQKDNFDRIKDRNKEEETGNTNKDLNKILNRAVRSKLWPIERADMPHATPGLVRYLKMVRDAAKGVNMYVADSIMGSFSGTSKERLESYAGIEDVPGDRKGYNEIAEIVATYENAIESLSAVTAHASTIQEAHDNIVRLVGNEDIKKIVGEKSALKIMGNLSEVGYGVMGIYEYNKALPIFRIAKLLGEEGQEIADKRTLRRPRAKLSDIEREEISKWRKDNPNPTPQDVLDTFGFRGIEFGEWVGSKSGRTHLNLVFDAYHDLAEVLGVPVKAMSLRRGTEEDYQKGLIAQHILGMAFGSRGHGGRAVAHFEPLNNVINLTRDSGDGSVSHEWAHGLDDALVALGFNDVVQDVKNALEVKYNIEKAKAAVQEMLTGNSYWNRRRIGKTPVEVARKFLEAEWEDHIKETTNFTKNAIEIGGKNSYWNRPQEKWARAFESFILDELKGNSPYLVNDWVDGNTTTKDNGYYQGNPYPQGEEREQFRRMFRNLFEGIEWTKDGQPSIKKDFKFIAEQERLRAEAEMNKLKAKLEEMFAAMHQGEASKDGLWWYEYTVTKRANLMQPKGISAHDDKLGENGAVGYAEALLPDDILSFRLKAITHDVDDSKIYLKEAQGDELIVPGTRLDTAGLAGESSLGEAPPKDGERVKGGPSVPGGPTTRTGEDVGGTRPEDTGGGVGQRGEGVGDEEVDTSAGGTSGPILESGSDAVLVGGNYRITDIDALGAGSLDKKFTDNLAAIRTLKQIEMEGRQASVAEQSILVKYVGWGGMSNAFDEGKEGWKAKFDILKETLTEDEYKAAMASTTSSFYTSPEIVRSMYTALEKMGFKGGRILEPAVGTGNFLGLLPDSLVEDVQFAAIERDGISARLTKQLYQRAGVFHNSYQDVSLPKNFYDVAISNVPFSTVVPFDNKYNQGAFKLHDYYFIKSLAMVRPGGIVAFVTSKGTMDKVNNKVRKAMAKQAEFVGAIRLPDTAFKDAGTKVTADIIFLRKKGGEGKALPETKFLEVKEFNTGDVSVEGLFEAGYGTNEKYSINEYFVKNPDMMLGKMSLSGRWEKKANLIDDGRDMDKALEEAVNKLPTEIYSEAAVTPDVDMAEALPTSVELLDGNYYEESGKLFIHIAGQPAQAVEETTNAQKKNGKIIREFIKLRGVRRDLLKSQLKEEPEAVMMKHIKELNKVYDGFVKKFGFLNLRQNMKAFLGDPEDGRVLALELWDAETDTATKSFIFTKRFIEIQRPVTKVDTPADALPHSLNTIGRVDIPYIADLSGHTEADVITELEGSIWNDPEIGWVMTEDYLSGNIKQKIAFAKQALKSDKGFQKNIDALTPLIPVDLPPSEIHSGLGAPWVEPGDIQDFIRHLIPAAWAMHVDYVQELGRWIVKPTGYSKGEREQNYRDANQSIASRSTWGIDHLQGHFFILLNKILNGGVPRINIEGVVSVDLTRAAQGKMEAIKAKFGEWLWEDAERTAKYVRKYNDIYNTDREKLFDGSHQTFPGQAPDITLVKHQRDGVWRAITTGLNIYYAHEVGTGKTYVMATTIMEAKRLGLKKKAILLAVNTNIQQIEAEFIQLYPAAKILRIDVSEKNKLQRKIAMNRIANEDWDAVIMNHNSFKFMQMSPEAQAEAMEEEIGNLRLALAMANQTGAAHRTVKEIQDKLDALAAKQAELLHKLTEERTEITFEELGIDLVVVDEAHEFKNLAFATGNPTGVKGLGNPKGNKSTFDMYTKTKWINQKYGGGVVFASGTPVTNSVAEIYNIMKYLDPQSLRDRGVQTFDAWSNTFGEITQAPELAPEGGSFKMVTKFNNFVNVPELWDMFRKVVDIVKTKTQKLKVPKMAGGRPTKVVIPMNEMVEAHAQELINRSNAYSQGGITYQPRGAVDEETGERAQDNLLAVIMDGRKAAMDMRLVDPELPDHPDTKVNKAVEIAYQSWVTSKDVKGGILIFSDIGIPKMVIKRDSDDIPIQKVDAEGNGLWVMKEFPDPENPGRKVKRKVKDFVRVRAFDIFTDMKNKLIARGIPENEIIFPRDSKGTSITNKKARLKAFNDIKAGRKRIIIGSTADMGIGVNIQERLVSLIAMDTDWNFKNADQRLGRIIRQGNIMYDKGIPVSVFNLMTKGTVDAFMWGKVADKKRTTEVVFSDTRPIERVVKEISSDTANMQEAMASASGDERFVRMVELEAEVSKMQALRGAHRNNKFKHESELSGIPSIIRANEAGIEHREKALEYFGKINGAKIGEVMYDLKKDSAALIKRMAEVLSPENVKKVHKSPNNIPIATFGVVETEEVESVEKGVTKINKVLSWAGMDTSIYVRSPFALLGAGGKTAPKEAPGVEELKIGTKTRYGEFEMSASGGLARLLGNTKSALERQMQEKKEDIEKAEKKRGELDAEIQKPFKEEEEYLKQSAELTGLKTDLQSVMQDELARRSEIDTDLERFKTGNPNAIDVGNFDDTKLDEEDEQRDDDIKLSTSLRNNILMDEKKYWDISEKLGQALIDEDAVAKASLEEDLAKINRKLSISNKVKKGQITGQRLASGIVGEVYQDLFDEAELALGTGRVTMKLQTKEELSKLPGIANIAAKAGVPLTKFHEKYNVKGAYQRVTVNGVAARGIIMLSMDGVESLEGMEQTVRHEIFHGVWGRLLNDNDRDIIFKKFGDEEKAADAFADYVANKGKLQPMSIRGVFDRVKEFFSKLRNKLIGRGFRSVGDIFADAAGGTLSDKASTHKDVGPDVSFSIEEGSNEEDLIEDHEARKAQLNKLLKSDNPVLRQLAEGLRVTVTQNPHNVLGNKDRSALVEEIYAGTSNKDIKWHERMFGLPYHLAKKYKEWNGALGIELKRDEERNLLISEFNKKVGPLKEGEKDLHEIMALKRGEEEGVLHAVYEGDGRGELFKESDLRTGIKLDVLGQLDPKLKGKVVKLSDTQIAAYNAWQTSHDKMKDRIVEAIENLTYLPYQEKPWLGKLKSVVNRHKMQRDRQRKVETDQGKRTDFSELSEKDIPERMKPEDQQEFIDAFNKVLPKQIKIKQLRADMGEVVGYATRRREGKFAVTTYDNDGNTLWADRSEKESDNKAMIDNQIERMEAEGFKHGVDFVVRKEVNDRASEFIFDQIQAVSVERFIAKALKQAETKEKIKSEDIDAISDEMIRLLTDEFKQRGFARTMMKRKRGFPIGGYKIENIKKSYGQYISGASGYMTKQIGAFEYANLLRTIDINAKPALYEDIAKYSGDMLRNQTRIDRVGGRIRTAAFVWYLSGQLKSPMVNFTQNWILGIPLLEKEFGKGGRKIYHGAMFDLARRRISGEEKTFLKGFQERGITGDQLTQEIMGSTTAEAGKLYESAIRTLGLPFSLSEIWNRKSSALAMFRAARGKGLSLEESTKKARKFVFDVHFLYGKLNAPSGARGGTPGAAVLRTSLTFRNYTFNFLTSMKDLLSERDFKTVAKSMVYMSLLGGLSSLPFLDGFLDMLERLTGISWRKDVKKELEEGGGEILAAVAIQGLPSLIGADIGGSLRIHFPDVTSPGKLIEESVFGVYEGLALKGVNSIKAATSGQIARAFEIAAPVFIERPLKAIREREGLTTTRGKIIQEPSGKQIQPTISETVVTGFGFRSSRLARLSDNYRQFGNIKKFYSDWRNDIYTSFRLAKTSEKRKGIIDEVMQYNRAANDTEGAVPFIKSQQLKEALKTRVDKRFRAFSQ